MYAIRTRNGGVYMKFKKNFGDMSAFEVRTRRVCSRQLTGLLNPCPAERASPQSHAYISSAFQYTAIGILRAQDDMDESEKLYRKERGGGNYGIGTKEVQERNYIMVSAMCCIQVKYEKKDQRSSCATASRVFPYLLCLSPVLSQHRQFNSLPAL